MIDYQNSFFRFFPPPAFIRMDSVGLDIGARFVRFVELVQKGNTLVLQRYGEEPVPEGSIVNGEIKNPDALEATLARMRVQHDLSFVRTAVSEKLGYLFGAQIARVSRKEIRGAIGLRLEEFIPIPERETIFDYDITDCPAPSDGKFWNTGVAALPQSIAIEYTELLRRAGLFPLSLELEAHPLARALIEKKDCGTILVADIGATKTGVFVMDGGVVHFSSSIAIGGQSFTNAIARSLAMPFQNAETLKRTHGLVGHYGKGELFSVLAPLVSTLRDEIGRYVNFWQTHEHGGGSGGDALPNAPIERIILSGGEAHTPGMRDYLSQSLRMEVVLGNPWINVSNDPLYIPELHFADALRYTTAIGLALGNFSSHD